MGKIVRAGAGAGIFDKLEPDKKGPAPQHWVPVLVSHSVKIFPQKCTGTDPT
jgi:hypothetical protein